MWCIILSVVVFCVAVQGQWPVDPNGLPTLPNATHTCSMWGNCVTVGGIRRTCRYDGAAPQMLHNGVSAEVRDEVREILLKRCPQLILDENGNVKPDEDIYTCCDIEQLRAMAESMNLADSVIGRCPTCLRNFVRQICEMNCSPEQSRFLDVYTQTAQEQEYITEIDYRVHEDFLYGAHSSCSNVFVPQTGLPAINLMCGNAPVCDAAGWFGYSGDLQNNPFISIQVNYLFWPTTEDSMNEVALPCNETYYDDIACGCVDCASACPVGTEPVVPELCTVGSFNCIGFSVAISFFVVGVIIFSILTIVDYKRSRTVRESKTVRKNAEIGGLRRIIQNIIARIGLFSMNHPMIMIMVTSWICFAMYFGFINIGITSKPIELWSAPDSRSRQEFNYFNSRFGPFYRAAQVFLTFDLEPFIVDNVTYGPAFRYEAVQELINIEDAIININRNAEGIKLEQVCYAPLRSRNDPVDLDACVVMSASTYLGSDRNNINSATYLNKILGCLNNHYSLECLSSWGGGSEPEITFAGYDDNIYSANTLVINFPITNHLYEEDLEPVMQWEKHFLDLLHEYSTSLKPSFVEVAYGAERSIEDEIERVSQAEVIPILISYILMFCYVTVALGRFISCRYFFHSSKVGVAVTSIIVVLLAIFCAIGLMGFAGITTTLLAINVIPFFVLSVGVDNVFLMVNTMSDIKMNLKQFDDYSENFDYKKKKNFIFEKMLQRVGPSIFVTAFSQITCFAIGSLAKFPAVITFALFSTFSMVFLFIFQMTTIVAILSFDYDREEKKRLDVFCCMRGKILGGNLNEKKSLTDRLMGPYSKFILNWKTKIIVMIIFLGITSTSVMLIPQIEVGLDQQLALPKDSYVYTYLKTVNEQLKIGPPVYFVLKSGLDFSNPVHQNAICGGRLCNTDSLVTQIFLAARHSEVTHIAKSSNSWIDDFFDWCGLKGTCCKYNTIDNGFCQTTNTSDVCEYCDIEMEENGIRPIGEAYDRYIPFFLQDAPNDICNKGGLASYFNNVNYQLDESGRATVQDSNFMAYHIALGTSEEYINAVKYGYEISDNITQAIKRTTGVDVEVFPYAVFYPFYEQYLTMWADTFLSIGYSFIGVLIITLITTGFNVLTTFVILFTTMMVVVNMMGVMYIWSIPLNAVSCINLIVSIAISVEFCSHLVYAFTISEQPPRDRVADALKKVGATIITGITLTNIPVIVLAFSYTEMIEIFFFRMFFSLILIGFTHGIIFLPVLLSFLVNVSNKK